MRSQVEKIELCIQFVQERVPRWVFHPDVLSALRLKEVRFLREEDMQGNRGYAIEHKIRVSAVTAKWRHASPYTSPCGKSDLSPLGVFAHEMGHILEFASWRIPNGPRFQLDWKDLHHEKRGEGITSYARSNWREDLAESNRLFVLNPKLLKELSPDRHDTIRRMYEELLGTKMPQREYKLSLSDFRKQFSMYVQ